MSDLRRSLSILKKMNDLKEIDEEFSTELEISSLANYYQKKNGPALLFNKPSGFNNKVVIGLFGTYTRLESIIERKIFDISQDFEGLFETLYSKPSLIDGLKLFSRMKNFGVNEVGNGPVKEKYGDITLDDIPVLKNWPKDGGKYITAPVVITKDPESGIYNAGTYRMQIYDSETTGMHWQTQKTGMMHMMKAKKMGKVLDVAVAIGVHPAILFSSVSPLPEGIDEMAFSGYLMENRVDVVKGETVDLRYPSNAEIVLEGYVDPNETKEEGPFGDHTGYYTPVDLYPVFHIKRIYHRNDFIYHSILVGKYWNEDVPIGRAIERMFLPAIKFQIPEIKDIFLPEEGLFNDVIFVSIKKRYPGQGRKVGMAILSTGQMMFTKYVVVVDEDIDVSDRKEILWAISTRTDPARDIEIIKMAPTDSLDHSSLYQDVGGKMIIDATVKGIKEGVRREWPQKIEMDENEILKEKMKKYVL
jgi:4-hydroxy-3-polyprenylbenzoate decarboxylase